MVEERVRRGLLLRTVMEILRDVGTKLSQQEVDAELRPRVRLNSQEWSVDNSGLPRYERAVGFHAGDAATVGWMSKIGGWSITEAGVEALDTYESADELWTELRGRLREVDRKRKEAQSNLSEVQQFVAEALALVEPGRWTAHDDLAALAGTTPDDVAHFLASIKLVNAYRVLNADGSVPDEGMLHFVYRGADLRKRLADEGIEFDVDGHAAQAQRLTSEALRDLLEARAEDELPPSVKRAWMVRGTSVDGFNLVPEWLREGFVSLSASQLASLDPSARL